MIAIRRRTMIFLTLGCTGAVFALAQHSASDSKTLRPLRIDDLHRLESVSDPEAVSSDGALALVRGGSKNAVTNELIGTITDIWGQEAPGKALVNVTNGASDSSNWSNPLWSPDGKRLLIRSTRGGLGTMPWVWDRDTKKLQRLVARRLTNDHSLGWIEGRHVLCMVQSVAEDAPDPAYAGDTEAWKLMKEGWARMVKGTEPSANVLDSPSGSQSGNAGAQPNTVDLVLIDAGTLAVTPVVTSLSPASTGTEASIRHPPAATSPSFARPWPARSRAGSRRRMGQPLRRSVHRCFRSRRRRGTARPQVSTNLCPQTS